MKRRIVPIVIILFITTTLSRLILFIGERKIGVAITRQKVGEVIMH